MAAAFCEARHGGGVVFPRRPVPGIHRVPVMPNDRGHSGLASVSARRRRGDRYSPKRRRRANRDQFHGTFGFTARTPTVVQLSARSGARIPLSGIRRARRGASGTSHPGITPVDGWWAMRSAASEVHADREVGLRCSRTIRTRAKHRGNIALVQKIRMCYERS